MLSLNCCPMTKNSESPPSLVNSPTSIDSESSNLTSSSVETSPTLKQNPTLMTLIRPPFPPTINIDDLVMSKPNGDKPSKSSNAFIIYRKAYVKELHSRGINLRMTQISPMVSESWKQEPENVKAEYKLLAEAAKKRYKEVWPSKQKRRQQRRNQQQQEPLPQSLFIDLSTKPSNELSRTQAPMIDLSQWDFSQSPLWSLGGGNNNNHQMNGPPLQGLTLNQMFANPSDELYNNNNDDSHDRFNFSLPLKVDLVNNTNIMGDSSSSLLNYINNNINNNGRGTPITCNNNKGAPAEYHQLMINWHKDLRRQGPHPYKTFADAASVSFFALHLV